MKWTICEARRQSGKKVGVMAGLMRMSPDTYRWLERHPDRFTVAQALRFSQITGFTLDELNFLP